MKLRYTRHFLEDYHRLPQPIQKRMDKQLNLLLENFHHPSLRTKIVKGTKEKIWEARVTRGCRFTFQTEREVYILRKIGTHDILKSP